MVGIVVDGALCLTNGLLPTIRYGYGVPPTEMVRFHIGTVAVAAVGASRLELDPLYGLTAYRDCHPAEDVAGVAPAGAVMVPPDALDAGAAPPKTVAVVVASAAAATAYLYRRILIVNPPLSPSEYPPRREMYRCGYGLQNGPSPMGGIR